MKLVVFGAGYVGLVTAVCLAAKGHEVRCVEVDARKVDLVRTGKSPIFEPGLEELLQASLANGCFRITECAEEGLVGAEMSMIAVGTPDQNGRIDLRYVQEVADTLGRHLRSSPGKHVVVVKSTVVPGTTEGPVKGRLEAASGLKAGEGFGLGMNPEFLREGFGVEDFMRPDRVVMGASDPWTADRMAELYRGFDCPKVAVSLSEAEFIKYTANALLANLISFSNEIFNLCEAVPGVCGRKVIEGALLDRRWTPEIEGRHLRPGVQSYVMGGIGYGGSCFPKDLNAITALAREKSWPVPLLDAVVTVNRERPLAIVRRLATEVGGLEGRQIAVLGLAFKPGTDDWRNSPSTPLVDALLEAGAKVTTWDPLAEEVAVSRWDGRVGLQRSVEDLLRGADAAIVATAWPELRTWDWPRLLGAMTRPVIYDGRNLLWDLPWPEEATYIAAGSGQKVMA